MNVAARVPTLARTRANVGTDAGTALKAVI